MSWCEQHDCPDSMCDEFKHAAAPPAAPTEADRVGRLLAEALDALLTIESASALDADTALAEARKIGWV